MPYISQKAREFYDEEVQSLINKLKTVQFSAGDMNYIMSVLSKAAWDSDKCYSNGNKIMGVFASASSEFYRRYLSPLEDEKIKQNGDI